ncbi:MAG: glycosyltransferase family 2 protein [Armatimonadota bacterium]|nr:glycosyltransferase family 2 protein [Armatimonadota bacterium]MDW8025303.1 glycosyltransferase family 2 protein [Armatimonadota bacterium]
MKPTVSFVIVNWNATSFLRQCLNSIYRNVSLPFEVLVIDNASSDTTPEQLEWLINKLPNAKLLVNERNLGYAAANNIGVERSSSQLVMLLNPDVIILRGCVERLVQFLMEHKDVIAVAPRLLYPNGKTQPTCRSFPTPLALLYASLGLDRLMPNSKVFGRYRMTWWRHDDLRQVDQPMASAMLFRRDAFIELGGFDEGFPIFFNDVDFCYRAYSRGFKIYFLPDAVAVHYHGASTRHLGARLIVESHISLLRFYSKHYRAKIGILPYAFTRGIIMIAMPLRYIAAAIRRLISFKTQL